MHAPAQQDAIIQVRDQIAAAEALKHQKWSLLNDAERQAVNTTIASTQRVVVTVEAEQGASTAGLGDRDLTIRLRNGSISVSQNSWTEEALMKLTIASQSLAAIVALLSARQHAPLLAELPGEMRRTVGNPRPWPSSIESERASATKWKPRSGSMPQSLLPEPHVHSMPRAATTIPELPGDLPIDVPMKPLPAELSGGYIPYRGEAKSKSMTALQPAQETSTLPEVVGGGPRLVGRARSRKWLQSHAEAAGPVASGYEQPGARYSDEKISMDPFLR